MGEGYEAVGVFDMKRAEWNRSKERLPEYMKTVKDQLIKCITQGGLFIINLDDSDAPSEDKYHSDLREFFDPSTFPMHVLAPKELKTPEVLARLMKDSSIVEKTKQRMDSAFQVSLG